MTWLQVVQRNEGWRFDLRSAIIGALLAWIIAVLLYHQRDRVKRALLRLWAPIKAWRERVKATQEEKYLHVLRQRLRQLLLYHPADPDLVFCPPTFRAPAPLPASAAEAAEWTRTITVAYHHLFNGHSKLILIGQQGSGRTMSQVMYGFADGDGEQRGQPFPRLPIWIDLALLPQLKREEKTSGIEGLTALAGLFMPEVLPKWLQQHIRRDHVIFLLDNWDRLTADERIEIAQWIAEVDQIGPDVFWTVAASAEGTGPLVEAGFVPVEILSPTNNAVLERVHLGWQTLFEKEPSATDDICRAKLEEALHAGAPLWELHLRTILYFETGDLPDRPIDVMDRLLNVHLSTVDLGRGYDAVVVQAREIAGRVLAAAAAQMKRDCRPLSLADLKELIEAQLLPVEGRSRRLEAAVQRLVSGAGLLRQHAKRWHVVHEVWGDFLAARHLATLENGMDEVRAHLNDPTWTLLSEFYAGLCDVSELVDNLVREAQFYGNLQALLRATRWVTVSGSPQPWHKTVIKALAKTLLENSLSQDVRLSLAAALSRIAGPQSSAFFLRLLKHPSPAVRHVALRGIAWCGDPEKVIGVLTAALLEPDQRINHSAVAALRDLGTPAAISTLVEAMPRVDERLMPIIAEALASVGPSGWEALREACDHPDLLVRRAAAYGLGQLDEEWAREQLIEMAREDPEWLVRSAADAGLQAQEERVGTPPIVSPPPEVDKMDWLIAWAARQGQGVGVGEAALKTLLQALSEGNPDAKVMAALTLAQIGRESHLSALESLMQTADPLVQEAATTAVQQIRRRYQFPTTGV